MDEMKYSDLVELKAALDDMVAARKRLDAAVQNLRRFRLCEECGEPIDVTHHTAAKRLHDKCANRKHQREYRKRQR